MGKSGPTRGGGKWLVGCTLGLAISLNAPLAWSAQIAALPPLELIPVVPAMPEAGSPALNLPQLLATLPLEQREQMRQQMREHWQQLTPEQREARRQEIRDDYRRMPQEDRQRLREELRERREMYRGGDEGGGPGAGPGPHGGRLRRF